MVHRPRTPEVRSGYAAASEPFVGESLYAANGSWPNGSSTFTYQWLACDASGNNCVNAAGSPSTSRVYTLVQADAGKTMRVAVTGNNGGTQTSPPSGVTQTVGVQFPLKASANGRYLVDQAGTPFLLISDSPQALIVSASPTISDTNNVQQYLAARKAQGFTAAWMNLLADDYTGGQSSGATYDSIKPFNTGTSPSSYDLSTPNTTYFARALALVELVTQTYGLVAIIDPLEGNHWAITASSNGATKCYNFGLYVGNLFKSIQNIIWLSGNDYTASNDLYFVPLAQGIRDAEGASAASWKPQTLELWCPPPSGSLDAVSDWGITGTPTGMSTTGMLDIDAAYTYGEGGGTYDQILTNYNRATHRPVVLIEGNYEGEQNDAASPISGKNRHDLRAQEYWTMLSGGCGQLFGEYYTSFLFSISGPGCQQGSDANWWSKLSTPGAGDITNLVSLLSTRAWHSLVPDQPTHGAGSLVSAGYGTYGAASYVASGVTADGKLGLAYLPNAHTGSVTINIAAFSGPVTARWYDPSNGAMGTTIAGSPFTNSGTHAFTTTGANAGADSDWVLVLEA